MNVHEIRRYRMLARVRDFGAARKDAFSEVRLAGKLFAAVGAAVSAVDEHAVSQASGHGAARDGALSRDAARRMLRAMLHAISRTARALETGTTRVGGKFRLPRAPRDQALVSLARAFAKNAVPLARTFVAHAMPATFLADLHAAVDAFEAAGRDHRAARGAHVAARVRIERTIARGFRAVRRLDAIVANHLRGDPAALAEWRRARRIERSPRQNPGRAPATAAPASRRPAAA